MAHPHVPAAFARLQEGRRSSARTAEQDFPSERRSGQGIIAVLEGTSRCMPLKDQFFGDFMAAPGADAGAPMMDPMLGGAMMGGMMGTAAPPMFDMNGLMGGLMNGVPAGMIPGGPFGTLPGAFTGVTNEANPDDLLNSLLAANKVHEVNNSFMAANVMGTGGVGAVLASGPVPGMAGGMPVAAPELPAATPGASADGAAPAAGADAGIPSPMMAAMMMPVTEAPGLQPGEKGPSAMELMQQAATDPTGATEVINTLLGAGTCDESSVQAAAMQVAMRQTYAFATNMAKGMGYHSLEHYELHRQGMVRASSSRGKKGNIEKKMTLFVGGLRKETTDDAMKDHFNKYGRVTRADIIRNSDGTSRGFGFVRFETDDEIHKCVEHKFEHILDGQWVNVKVSDPNRADAGKNASRAVEIAAIAAGVEPSRYLDYLTELGQAKYGYGGKAIEDDSDRKDSRNRPY